MTDPQEYNGPEVHDEYEDSRAWLDREPSGVEAFLFFGLMLGLLVFVMCLGGTL